MASFWRRFAIESGGCGGKAGALAIGQGRLVNRSASDIPLAVPARPGSGVPGWPRVTALLVVLGFVLLCHGFFRDKSSADFMALWLAGESLALGMPDQVYPADTGYFTMLPPPEWVTRLRLRGYDGEVFPFVYPPLWAWLAAKATGLMRYETFLAIAGIVNPALLAATVALAWRLMAPAMGLALFLGLGLGFMGLTTVGSYALYQDQPQILVAFLTVLALERAERGRPGFAGAALALAAAIKIYPALFALCWLAAGQRRAAASFAVAGAVLGGLSVFLAGWPLHMQFLRVIGTISDTAMLTTLSYTWESFFAHLLYWDQAITITPPNFNPDYTNGQWMVLPKPLAFSLAFKLLLAAALALVIRLFLRAGTAQQRIDIWPFALTLLPLVSPVGWGYYYIAAAAFVPVLAERLGFARGLALMTVLIFGTSPYIATLLTVTAPTMPQTGRLFQTIGTISISALAAGYFLARRPAQARPRQDLRRKL